MLLALTCFGARNVLIICKDLVMNQNKNDDYKKYYYKCLRVSTRIFVILNNVLKQTLKKHKQAVKTFMDWTD